MHIIFQSCGRSSKAAYAGNLIGDVIQEGNVSLMLYLGENKKATEAEVLEQVRAGGKRRPAGQPWYVPHRPGAGLHLRGDFGLEIYNAQALKEYTRLGLQSATLSFELKLAQIRDLSKC